MTDFVIEWIDSGKEPKSPPNPAYPKGIALDLAQGLTNSCIADLSYPAKRIGYYDIQCRACGARVAVTTAGRPDDPVSVKIGCWLKKTATTTQGKKQ